MEKIQSKVRTHGNLGTVKLTNPDQLLEAVSKLHLVSNGSVAIRFKMLTYYVYAPLFNRIDALTLNTIYNFETSSNYL